MCSCVTTTLCISAANFKADVMKHNVPETTDQLLEQLFYHLRSGDEWCEWSLSQEEARATAETLEIAQLIAKGLIAELHPGEPQACLGWQIACDECTYAPVRWKGIAFSEIGAQMLLQEHKAQAHR